MIIANVIMKSVGVDWIITMAILIFMWGRPSTDYCTPTDITQSTMQNRLHAAEINLAGCSPADYTRPTTHQLTTHN